MMGLRRVPNHQRDLGQGFFIVVYKRSEKRVKHFLKHQSKVLFLLGFGKSKGIIFLFQLMDLIAKK